MAWGRKTVKPPPVPKSTLSKLLPLIFLFCAIGIFAFIGYHIYLSILKISETASQKLEKKNVTFSKDGLKVGVKEIKNETYVDKTQGMLVKAWNLSTWPAYKSRLWNKEADEKKRS